MLYVVREYKMFRAFFAVLLCCSLYYSTPPCNG